MENTTKLTEPHLYHTPKNDLRSGGMFYDGSGYSKVSVVVSFFCVTLNFASLSLKVVLDSDELTVFENMQLINYVVLHLLLIPAWAELLINTKLIQEMDTMIKNRFGVSELTMPEKLILNEGNAQAAKLSRFNSVLYFFVWLSFFRDFSPADWIPPYISWYPWKLNSWPKYIFTSAVQLLFVGTVLNVARNMVGSYLTFTIHLTSHQKMIMVTVADTFSGDERETSIMLDRLKRIHRHQHAIKKFAEGFNNCLKFTLLVFNCIIAGSLCFLLYMLTLPGIATKQQFEFVALIMPEAAAVIILSNNAQIIKDKSERFRDSLYDTTWYEDSVPVQKMLLMMLLGSFRPIEITAGGMFKLSRERITNITQTSFTYFNMLRATSNQ